MDVGGVLQRDDVLALGTAEAELRDRGGGVVEQPSAVRGIDPRVGDDLRPVHRAEVVLVGLDDRVDRVGGDEAPLDEQRLDRGDALLDLGERRRVVTVVVVAVVVVAVVAVAHSR